MEGRWKEEEGRDGGREDGRKEVGKKKKKKGKKGRTGKGRHLGGHDGSGGGRARRDPRAGPGGVAEEGDAWSGDRRDEKEGIEVGASEELLVLLLPQSPCP
eukprot:3247026-Rhodomonas_salina.5